MRTLIVTYDHGQAWQLALQYTRDHPTAIFHRSQMRLEHEGSVTLLRSIKSLEDARLQLGGHEFGEIKIMDEGMPTDVRAYVQSRERRVK